MALSNTLNTNEIKNAAGTEVEYSARQIGPGSFKEFAKIGEQYNLPDRLSVKIQESGQGINKRRRTLTRFDETVMSGVDASLPVTGSIYVVSDFPIGALTNTTLSASLVAKMNSFMASDGAGTTILYAGTGTGAKVHINGEI